MDKEVAHIEGDIRLGRKKEGALFIGSDAGGPGGRRAERGESGRGRRRPEDLTRTWSLKDKTNTRNRDKLAEAESVPVAAGRAAACGEGERGRGAAKARRAAAARSRGRKEQRGECGQHRANCVGVRWSTDLRGNRFAGYANV